MARYTAESVDVWIIKDSVTGRYVGESHDGSTKIIPFSELECQLRVAALNKADDEMSAYMANPANTKD